MSLVTYEDTHGMWTMTKDVHDAVLHVIARNFMPYVALNDPPTSLMPPVESLSDDEKQTLLTWLIKGALPEGGTDCP